MYSMHIYYYPELAAEYRSKQMDQALYFHCIEVGPCQITAAAHDIAQVIAPVNSMTTGRSPDLHHRTSTVMD